MARKPSTELGEGVPRSEIALVNGTLRANVPADVNPEYRMPAAYIVALVIAASVLTALVVALVIAPQHDDRRCSPAPKPAPNR